MLRSTLMAAFLTFAVVPTASSAIADSLSGSWAGSGSVRYGDTRERASCRARYSRIGGTSYTMNAQCATPSGRVDQSATLNRVGKNRYAGSFYNSQFGVTGSIFVVLRGRSMSVSLSSAGGTGSFKMRRR
ncbi:MAG: hypothetical protein KDJ37_10940 [Hyphomicrobiaceae bacterium]|nr:hypothetical protein [Hyphomicrobiaceae bacterium]